MQYTKDSDQDQQVRQIEAKRVDSTCAVVLNASEHQQRTTCPRNGKDGTTSALARLMDDRSEQRTNKRT